jgi:hypothetical protein
MKKYILIFAIFTLLTSYATLTQKTAETPTENYVVAQRYAALNLQLQKRAEFGLYNRCLLTANYFIHLQKLLQKAHA